MKEDDMDEMLRQAAENYEVDSVKAADWNAVYTAVHEKEEAEPVEKKKRKRIFAFWWLLLIPLGWIANTEYNKFHATRAAAKNNSASSVQQKNTNAVAKQTTPQKSLTVKSLPEKNTTAVIDNSIIHQKDAAKRVSVKRNSDNNLNVEKSLANKQSPSNQTPLINQTTNNLTAKNPESQQSNNQSQPGSSKQTSSNIADNKIVNNSQTDIPSPDITRQKNSLPVVADNNAKNKQTATANPASVKIKANGHYFYGGLTAGTDLSFIKYQKAEPLGYNVGLLVGYKFNKLSIESGLLLDKKNYYTSGEYFDKSKIPFFGTAELLSANGYCRMYEIPLNIKYDISTSKKHTWFATAGLSSYLMNKEFYHYAYKQNGVDNYGSYPYFHTTKNWFSVVNLSAGYQLQLNAKSNLRIEPYYKTTLSGVGTGSLTITSTGINIGITKRIH